MPYHNLTFSCNQRYILFMGILLIGLGQLPVASAQSEPNPKTRLRLLAGYTHLQTFGRNSASIGGNAFYSLYAINSFEAKPAYWWGVEVEFPVNSWLSFQLGFNWEKIRYDLNYSQKRYQILLTNSRNGPASANAGMINFPLGFRLNSETVFAELAVFASGAGSNKGEWTYEKFIHFEDDMDGNVMTGTFYDPPLSDGSDEEVFAVQGDQGILLGFGFFLDKSSRWTAGVRWRLGFNQLMDWKTGGKYRYNQNKRLRRSYISVYLSYSTGKR